MSDKSSKLEAPAPAANAPAPAFTEIIPSMPNAVSGIASAFAPFVFFDSVPFHSVMEGNALLTLTASRYIGHIPGQGVPADHIVVAHLRCSLPALIRLRSVIDEVMLNASVPTPSPEDSSAGLPN